MSDEPTPRLPWRELRRRTQPRRGLALREAALYVGVTPRKFGRAVMRREAPQPRMIMGQAVWDMADLDAYIEAQPSRDQARKPAAKGVPFRV